MSNNVQKKLVLPLRGRAGSHAGHANVKQRHIININKIPAPARSAGAGSHAGQLSSLDRSDQTIYNFKKLPICDIINMSLSVAKTKNWLNNMDNLPFKQNNLRSPHGGAQAPMWGAQSKELEVAGATAMTVFPPACTDVQVKRSCKATYTLGAGKQFALRNLTSPNVLHPCSTIATERANKLSSSTDGLHRRSMSQHIGQSHIGGADMAKPCKIYGKFIKYNLETYHRSNQDTCLIQKPAIKEGDWIQTGDLLADSASSIGGELAIGHNIIVAYMPWEGYNYEDAILINERLVYEDIYTSIHIERYEMATKDTKLGPEQITREIPDTNENEISHLDKHGIAKIGSWVEEGDILVGKITPFNIKTLTPQQKLLYKIFNKELSTTKDSSLRAPKGIKANVINVNILARQKVDGLAMGAKHQLKNADKSKKKSASKTKGIKQIAQGKNQKSNVAPISLRKPALPLRGSAGSHAGQEEIQSISHKKDGSPMKTVRSTESKLAYAPHIVFGDKWQSHPLGLRKDRVTKSNLNINKNIKPSYVHIYLAEKRKMQVGDKMAGRHGNKGIVSRILPRQDMPFLPDGTSVDIVLNPLGVPSRMNVGQIYECLLGLAGRYLGEHYKIPPFDEIYGADASRSFVLSKLYEARKKTGLKWLFDPNNPGKIRLFDGRTSTCFDQTVTIGIAYILKLVHMVDDKMHMRSTGPYSLVTQQPLRGRSKQGGQRLGEMEVWAIEGYGAAFVLSEMLTIKSDDMTGRQNLWKNLIENNEISLGSPESFKVLVCELQALCLDIGLFRKNTSKFARPLPGQDKNTDRNNVSSAPNLIEIDSLLHLA